MNYKDAFSIDDVYYNENQNSNKKTKAKYVLNNHDYYQPKLDSEFYLKYFMRELLIELDVLEVKTFLYFHYEKSKNTKLLIDILKYKVIPKIRHLKINAKPSFEGGTFYKEIKLDDGFIETEGKILKPEFEEHLISHFIAWNNLQEDLVSRMEIISDFVEQVNKVYDNGNISLLKWSGKHSHLAYFISQFILEGYIEAPINNDGEINYSELSRNILSSFEFKGKKPTVENLRKYSNITSDKFYPLNENFKKHGFELPNPRVLG